MGTGEAEGQDRSRVAAERARSPNPAPGRSLDEGRQGACSSNINRWPRHDPGTRSTRRPTRIPRGSRRRRQHHFSARTFRRHDCRAACGVSVVATGIAAMARPAAGAELPVARHEPADADRPAGAQPPRWRPPVGRVAMPAAAMGAAAPRPMARRARRGSRCPPSLRRR